MILRRGLTGLRARGLSTFARQSIAVSSTGPRTMYDKIWDDHIVEGTSDGTALLYIDRHLVHEVTSPQAFEGLSQAGRPVRRPDCTLVTVDHNVPTFSRKKFKSIESFIENEQSRQQVSNPALPPRALTLRPPPEPTPSPVPGDGDRKERAELQPRVLWHGGQAAGHRAHHRARAGLHPPRHHVRVRRLAHGDARRLWRAGVWHRHVGGGARARHLDAQPEEGAQHARAGRRRALARRHLQGRRAAHLRDHRHSRRHRRHHRVRRLGDPLAVDGGAHVHLQHGHRGGRARRADRAGRHHL